MLKAMTASKANATSFKKGIAKVPGSGRKTNVRPQHRNLISNKNHNSNAKRTRSCSSRSGARRPMICVFGQDRIDLAYSDRRNRKGPHTFDPSCVLARIAAHAEIGPRPRSKTMTKFFLLGLFGLQSAVMTAQAQVFDNLPINEAENSFALRGGARTAEGEPTASNWQSFHPNWAPLSDLVGADGRDTGGVLQQMPRITASRDCANVIICFE